MAKLLPAMRTIIGFALLSPLLIVAILLGLALYLSLDEKEIARL